MIQAYSLNEIADMTLKGRVGQNGVELKGLTSSGVLRFIWVVLGANLTMAFRHSEWLKSMWMAYAFNIGCILLFSVLFSLRGSTHGVTLALIGANLPRVLLATGLSLFMHVVLGEPIIRHTGQILRAFERCWNCSATKTFHAASCDDPGDDTSSPRDAREFRVQSNDFVAPGGHADVPEGHAPLLQDKGPSPIGVQTSQSLGYAFAEECQLERHSVRGRGSTASTDTKRRPGEIELADGMATFGSAAPKNFEAEL